MLGKQTLERFKQPRNLYIHTYYKPISAIEAPRVKHIHPPTVNKVSLKATSNLLVRLVTYNPTPYYR